MLQRTKIRNHMYSAYQNFNPSTWTIIARKSHLVYEQNTSAKYKSHDLYIQTIFEPLLNFLLCGEW